MLRIITVLACLVSLAACDKGIHEEPAVVPDAFIRAVDISAYPEIRAANPVFYDSQGGAADFITLLKNNGVNTIRLRLWVNPPGGHCGFDEVKQFSEALKTKGFSIWLSLHYSDTWADPAQQQLPAAWQGIGFQALKDSVYHYTKRVVSQLRPDYIQIGNEINSGFLFPHGSINNLTNFKELLQKGIAAVRETAGNTKIMLHYAGIEHAGWFFQQTATLNYDMIGLSYYPIWHGKSLTALSDSMQSLSSRYNREVVIAETSYPFTLGWNDWTNNIVGLNSQLVLPDFPASETGQRDFVSSVIRLTRQIPGNKGAGVCYWGAELISWRGSQATNGSPWENQALFNFQNRALPALAEFKPK